MVLPFLKSYKETPVSLRKKAEELLAHATTERPLPRRLEPTGENRLNRTGAEGDFRQFRLFRQGDRPQDIDWKRSARSDDVLIKEREKKQRLLLDLYIQNDEGMQFSSNARTRSKYETAAILGLGFSLWAKQNHDPVRFQGQYTDADSLAALLLDNKNHVQPHAGKNSLAIVIGDFLQEMPELEKLLSSVSAENVVLLQILDPAELDLPYKGRAIFENIKDQSTIENVDAIRSAYISALNTHIGYVKNYAAQRSWHYDLIRSDEDLSAPFYKVLISWMRER